MFGHLADLAPDENPAFRAEYRLRRRRVYTPFAAWMLWSLIAVIVTVYGWEPAGWLSIGGVIAYAVVHFRTWRCPRCGKGFGRSGWVDVRVPRLPPRPGRAVPVRSAVPIRGERGRMNHVHLQASALRAEFRRRKWWLNLSFAILAAEAVAALLLVGRVLPFVPVAGALFGTWVGYLVAEGVLWRCPRCERSLGRRWPQDACTHCSLVLDERKVAAYGEEKKKVPDTFWSGITREPGS